MTVLRLALCALFLATPAAAQQAPATDCDRLAGFDFAPRRADTPGLPYLYQAQEAVAACEAAVAQYPDEPYFRLQLARAQLAVDPTDPRGADLLEGLREALPGLSRGQLAGLTLNGLAGIEADLEGGRALFEEACAMEGDAGRWRACNDLGLLLTEVGGAEDHARAVTLFEAGCDAGSAAACMNLGYEYSQGGSVEVDLPRAAELYQRACDGGNPMGCNNLGDAYRAGRGVAQDEVRAAGLFVTACEAGEFLGCQNLGEAFRTGSGIDRNPGAAVRALAYACDGGLPVSCLRLAIMAFDGDGLQADPEFAASALQRTCELTGIEPCDRATVEAALPH